LAFAAIAPVAVAAGTEYNPPKSPVPEFRPRGDFISVRRPLEWTKGEYTYRLVKMDREEIDGEP
jgi:hypothetical protein